MSKNRLLSVAAIVAVIATASVLATTTASAKPAKQNAPIKLGFITKFPVDFYFLLVNAAKKWDKATQGASVIYASGKSGTDDAGEIAAIQNMVAQGVKGIAITPTSPAVSAALDKAIKAGVKVVLMDNDIPSWKKKSSVVATNNFNGGVLAGKYIASRLQPGDKLGVLAGVPGVPSLDDRVNGMLKGLGALRSKLKIVGQLETDCDQTKGFSQAQTILTANPDLKALYSACGPPALGADQALTNAHVSPGGFVMVGYDAQPEEITQIKAGRENASVAQFPFNIGLYGMQTLWKVVNARPVAANVDTGTALVTKANAAKFNG